MENISKNKELFKAYQNALNRHGYGFQYSVLNNILNLFNKEEISWLFEASEFPVNVQGFDTHIDFIIKHSKIPFYIISECKRANPALSDWCFSKAPYVHKKQFNTYKLFTDRVVQGWGTKLAVESYLLDRSIEVYQIPMEIKTNEKGDSDSKGRGSFNDAITQVIRGLNGLIECIHSNKFLREKEWCDLLPVVFTSANLWTTNVDLSLSNLTDGKIDFSSANFVEKEWIWFQYNQSPKLKHNVLRSSSPKEFDSVLDSEYSRSIAIVNSRFINNFLIIALTQRK